MVHYRLAKGREVGTVRSDIEWEHRKSHMRSKILNTYPELARCDAQQLQQIVLNNDEAVERRYAAARHLLPHGLEVVSEIWRGDYLRKAQFKYQIFEVTIER